MDLRRSRLTALSVTQSAVWPSSPSTRLVPPKKDADSTWTLCSQSAATAVSTLRASASASAWKCSCLGPAGGASPKAHSSPAFCSAALFRSRSARFLTKYWAEPLTVASRAEERTQATPPRITLDAVSTSSRSSRRHEAVPQRLQLLRSTERVPSVLSPGRNVEHNADRLESRAARSFPKSSAGFISKLLTRRALHWIANGSGVLV
ncbi:hypothetical protein EYF80_014355 [Liparis tanakae]|uniref:Uncharacterized protein n=1 Tax=Liparis tanakae TaxID=230148 RepID=A0A4Z2IBB3_9TELE|nr:hypothetical protein EYF80_014355 [Liparis tanakae]